MQKKEEGVFVAVEEELRCVQGGRAQEQKCTVEEWCIEGIWRREHKRKKNKKHKEGVEDTDADIAVQCSRIVMRPVSH